MRYAIGTLAALCLIGMLSTAVEAQDGWRPAKKKLAAPVRLASYQKEIPVGEDTKLASGPAASNLRTAQLQAPLTMPSTSAQAASAQSASPQLGTESGAVVTTQAVPQIVYYTPGGAANNCYCAPQTQGYTSYYQPTVAGYVPVANQSYTTFRPLLDLTPSYNQQYVGQGIFGQPKVYVPGQPVLNALRYISP